MRRVCIFRTHALPTQWMARIQLSASTSNKVMDSLDSLAATCLAYCGRAACWASHKRCQASAGATPTAIQKSDQQRSHWAGICLLASPCWNPRHLAPHCKDCLYHKTLKESRYPNAKMLLLPSFDFSVPHQDKRGNVRIPCHCCNLVACKTKHKACTGRDAKMLLLKASLRCSMMRKALLRGWCQVT